MKLGDVQSLIEISIALCIAFATFRNARETLFSSYPKHYKNFLLPKYMVIREAVMSSRVDLSDKVKESYLKKIINWGKIDDQYQRLEKNRKLGYPGSKKPVAYLAIFYIVLLIICTVYAEYTLPLATPYTILLVTLVPAIPLGFLAAGFWRLVSEYRSFLQDTSDKLERAGETTDLISGFLSKISENNGIDDEPREQQGLYDY